MFKTLFKTFANHSKPIAPQRAMGINDKAKLNDLEKNFLKMFGIILQLIVFYLPILGMMLKSLSTV